MRQKAWVFGPAYHIPEIVDPICPAEIPKNGSTHQHCATQYPNRKRHHNRCDVSKTHHIDDKIKQYIIEYACHV